MEEGEERSSMVYTEPQQQADEEKKCEDSSSGGRFPEMNDFKEETKEKDVELFSIEKSSEIDASNMEEEEEEKEKEQLSLNVQSYGIDDLEKIDGVSYFVSSSSTDASNVIVNDEEDFFPESFDGSVPSMVAVNTHAVASLVTHDTATAAALVEEAPSVVDKEVQLVSSPINADGVSSISVQEASMVPIDASDTPSPAVGPPIHEAFMVLTSLDASDIPSPAVAPPIHEASMVSTKLDASDTPSPAVAPPIHEDGAQSEVHMVPEEASITSPPTYTCDTTSISAPEVPRVCNEKISPSHADDAPLLPDQEAFSPPKVVEEAPPVGSKGSPSMVAEDVSLLVNEEVPSMPAEVAHEVVDKSILKATEDSPPVVDKHEFPMVNQEVSPMVDDGEVSPNFDEDASLIDNSPMVDDGEVTPNFDGDASLMDNGNAFPTAADEVMHAPDVDTEMDMDTEIETEAVEVSRRGGAKRKRGRPARVQAKVPPARIEEEDVCFICFDGGNLVLCDRRGCPKAYHPACVNRDDAFFRAKGRWNCGWHICSNCQKAAQYMCYTCTYSLCKACIKEADFFRVRGNRGFCAACMGTITLIEKNDQADKELAQVDFNDKTSWEYLFKEYWVDLKRKLSITPDELAQAKNPFKGSNIVSHKGESSEELYDANDDKGSVSDDSFGHHEVSVSKRRKPKRRSKSSKEEKPPNVIPVVGEGISSTNTEWASKELLEFVAHMKNGDKSVLSQFDVQALLLDYIKQNNLRDPRRKSQIVCDSRLENLFGKARVGHFEMLKLLESHFLLKEDAHAGDNQEPANNEANQIDGDDVAGVSTKISLDKRRKSRKKGDNKGPQTNLDDYAAVDAHNIKLLYLRRNLMEELLEDTDKFHDKVVGSFVRIRIPGSGQKHDMYRVVKVIGTQKAAEPYKTSKRSADVVLEILNLDKTELITIDTISNQEFTEDECKRLRQSIKCGLISPLTVGELQEKALTLQSVRVNDWLEMEKLRISHLRDRASEQGRRKDLRECVEKLQLLNTPEERFRRLQEIPEVHSDPKMDPNYESEEHEEHDDSPQGKLLISRDAGFSRKRRDPISPRKESLALVDTWNVASKGATASSDGRNMSTTGIRDRGYGASGAAESVNSDAHLVNSWEKPKNLSSAPILGNGTSSGIAVGRSEPPQDLGIPNLTDISSSINETEKMWHYKDPSGKVQGPFSMAQLRKWSTTGHFPADLRIWRISESSEDSILLNDALVGKFEKDLPKDVDGFVPPERAPSLLENNWGVSVGSSREGSTNTPWIDKTQIERGANSNWNNVGGFPNGGIQPLNSGVWNSASSSWTAPTTNFMGEQSGHFIQGGWDPTRGGNAWSGQSTNIPHSYSRQPHGPTSHQGVSGGGRWRGQGEGDGGRWRGQGDSVGGRWSRGQVDPSRGRWNRGQTRGNNWNSNRYRGGPQFSSGRGYDRRANNMGPSGQFSGENMRAPFDNRMNGWNSSNTGESPNMMTEGWGVNHCNKSSSDLPSPTPRSSNANRTDQASENKWSPTRSSTFQANPISSAAPMMGSTGVQLSAVGIPNPNKTASGWIEQQNLSATPTGGRVPSSGLVPVPPTAAAPMRVDTINQDVRDYSGPPTPTPMPIGNYLQP